MQPSSTPLISLDAVAFDTETTGLDAATARIVQMGALRIGSMSPDEAARFEHFVHPGLPIPPASSAIHGISDEDVQDAPRFAGILPELEAFFGTATVVGHTISYDRRVLEAECVRVGLTLQRRRWLDVRFLAELARPGLASYDLDGLASHFEVRVNGRHTAMGDARATAEIYRALLPLLRERGIRTLAEAEAASRALLDTQINAGRAPAAMSLPGATERSITQIDSFAYTHRVRDVMSSPPAWCRMTDTISAAASQILLASISSTLVDLDARGSGIVTERDILRALHQGRAGEAVSTIASHPLQTVTEDDHVYRAIGRMDRLGIRHLGVRNAVGEITGVVTPRNLLRHRASSAVVLGDAIDHGRDVTDLGRAWGMLAAAARSLEADRVEARDIASVISTEICALTRRAFELAEAHMVANGKGAAPCTYAVLVLGSAGRGESLIAADQDNALVISDAADMRAVDPWFDVMATEASAILDAVGVPLCKGGIMGKNPVWRNSVAGWNTTTDKWVRVQRPQDLLNVDIFFDGLAVHGDADLAGQVYDHAFAAAAGSVTFQKQLTELARAWRSPITLLGNLKADPDGRIDLKKHGLLPIFTAARVLAIRSGVRARSTAERLRGFSLASGTGADDIERLIAAHGTIMRELLRQQLIDAEQGVPLSPRVELKRLTAPSRRQLTTAVRDAAIAIDLVSEGRI